LVALRRARGIRELAQVRCSAHQIGDDLPLIFIEILEIGDEIRALRRQWQIEPFAKGILVALPQRIQAFLASESGAQAMMAVDAGVGIPQRCEIDHPSVDAGDLREGVLP